MGYMMATSQCCVCGQMTTYNPYRVPSYKRKPICESCITKINAEKKRLGFPEFNVPKDAYEPVQVD